MRIPGVPYIQGRNSYADRDGRKYGIAIHCTDNTAAARKEAGYATRRTDGVSGHFYVDGVEVIQSLDTDARAGHAGSAEGNDNAVAVEITGRVSASRQWWLDNVAWKKLAAVLAPVCREYGIQPRRATVAEMKADPRVRAFYGHDDMRRAWGGTTHTDPGPNFPWDHLLATVERAVNGDTEDDEMDQATFDKRLLGALKGTSADAREVQRLLRAVPWQYVGGGIPRDMSTLGVLNEVVLRTRAVGEMVARESSSPDEMRAILDEVSVGIANDVLAGLGGRPAAEVAQALVAAGQDPAALAAALTALAVDPGQARE